MKRPRRRFLYLAAGVAAAFSGILFSGHGAWAQTARTIKLIVPSPPGGSSDVWPVRLGDCQFRVDLYRRAAVSCRFFCRLDETRGLNEMLEARRTDWQKLFPATEQRPTAALPYLTLTLDLTRPEL